MNSSGPGAAGTDTSKSSGPSSGPVNHTGQNSSSNDSTSPVNRTGQNSSSNDNPGPQYNSTVKFADAKVKEDEWEAASPGIKIGCKILHEGSIGADFFPYSCDAALLLIKGGDTQDLIIKALQQREGKRFTKKQFDEIYKPLFISIHLLKAGFKTEEIKTFYKNYGMKNLSGSQAYKIMVEDLREKMTPYREKAIKKFNGYSNKIYHVEKVKKPKKTKGPGEGGASEDGEDEDGTPDEDDEYHPLVPAGAVIETFEHMRYVVQEKNRLDKDKWYRFTGPIPGDLLLIICKYAELSTSRIGEQECPPIKENDFDNCDIFDENFDVTRLAEYAESDLENFPFPPTTDPVSSTENLTPSRPTTEKVIPTTPATSKKQRIN